MPKLKTNKSVKKRFKVTKHKKVIRYKAKRRHLLTDKKSNKKRDLRGKETVKASDKGKIIKLMPYR